MNRINIIKNHIIMNNNTSSSSNSISSCDKIKVLEFSNGCRRIILNRNEALNSLTFEMINCIKGLLEKYSNDNLCKFIIISSLNFKDDKAFCSGGDIKEFSEFSQSKDGVNPFIKSEYKLDYIIHTYNKPIISFVNGFVMGGGVGLSIHCSIKIIGENVKWAMPENRIGYFPDVGTTFYLSRLGSIGLYLGLVGARINSKDLIHCKLATHYVPSDSYEILMEELCNNNDIQGERQIEFIISNYRKTLYADKESSILVKYRDLIDKCFSRELKSVIEIIEELDDVINSGDSGKYDLESIEWCKKNKDIILNLSCPTSICLSFETIHRAYFMDIEDIFQMEIRVGTRLGDRNDLVQGVKSTLIDKSYKPKYNPDSIYNIKKSFIDSFFVPFENSNLEFDLNY